MSGAFLPNFAVAVLTLLVGWGGLFPARRALGGFGYHLFAMPVGLLVWPMGTVLSSATGATYGLKIVVLALIVVTAALAAASWAATRGSALDRPVPLWSWGAWGGAYLVLAAVLTASKLTAGGYDSIFHYQSWGVFLRDVGAYTPTLIGDYSIFLPSLMAAVLALGGKWAFVLFPLMSVHLIGILGWAGYRSLGTGLAPLVRGAIVGAVVLLLVTVPTYLYHSFYAHSHMSSALFLLGSLVALREAYLGRGALDRGAASAWALVAGVLAACFAFVRTDGLAYLVVILLVAAVMQARFGARSVPRLAYLFGGLFTPLALVYGLAYAQLGIWPSVKMGGYQAGAVLAALAVIAVTIWVLAGWVGERFADTGGLLGMLVAANLAVIALAWSQFPADFFKASSNMIGNLTLKGGYGYTWLFAFGIVALGIALRRAWAADDWADLIAYAFAQFFFIALVVHGLTHPGRLAVADSFNRLAFHALPLAFLYGASVIGGLVAAATPALADNEAV